MIRIPRTELVAIREHGGDSYPEECCGGLIGRVSPDDLATVVRAVPLSNDREAERESRYLVGPRTILALEEGATSEGLMILGFYHSHPDHQGEPSQFDRRHAWPWYRYLILPVRAGVPSAPRVWRLRDDRSGFDEEEVVVEEAPAAAPVDTERVSPVAPGGE